MLTEVSPAEFALKLRKYREAEFEACTASTKINCRVIS
jgi:hypothetical protein